MEKKLILLVEDNPSDVELTRIAFEMQNITDEVVIARDGIEAIEYLFGKEGRDMQVMPNLILLDLKLPRMDGFAVLDMIRSHKLTRHIPVIIVTTSNDEQTITRSYNTGANDFIHKAPGFREFSEMLSGTIRKWMACGAGNEPAIKKTNIIC